MFDKIRDYLKDQKFRFTIYDDKIHIINFKTILILDDNYVSFKTLDKKIIIKGNNLILKRLEDKEMLIYGKCSKIEVEDE